MPHRRRCYGERLECYRLRVWQTIHSLESMPYRCGYCGNDVASKEGWYTAPGTGGRIRICPQCDGPTFFSVSATQTPGPLHGGDVSSLPEDIEPLYREARRSITVEANTGSIMLCRKILMNVSVAKGAPEGQPFIKYVQWLVEEGYAPRGSEGWVQYIKDRGNEANHEIKPMTEGDAIGVLRFTEQLLRNMFELPGLVPSSS